MATMEPPPWKSSEAKKLLFADIVSGEATDWMSPAEVFMMHPDYSLYKYSSFVANLRNLRIAVKKLKESAALSQRALHHDICLMPPVIMRTKPRWAGSFASRFLKEDVESGASTRMASNELWLSRAIYQAFSLASFKGHIHQEMNSRRERAYWSFQSSKKRG